MQSFYIEDSLLRDYVECVASFNRATLDDLAEHTLARHDAIAYRMVNRAMRMTFLSNLGELEYDIARFEARPDGQGLQIEAFHDDVLAKRAILGLMLKKCVRLNLLFPFRSR